MTAQGHPGEAVTKQMLLPLVPWPFLTCCLDYDSLLLIPQSAGPQSAHLLPDWVWKTKGLGGTPQLPESSVGRRKWALEMKLRGPTRLK